MYDLIDMRLLLDDAIQGGLQLRNDALLGVGRDHERLPLRMCKGDCSFRDDRSDVVLRRCPQPFPRLVELDRSVVTGDDGGVRATRGRGFNLHPLGQLHHHSLLLCPECTLLFFRRCEHAVHRIECLFTKRIGGDHAAYVFFLPQGGKQKKRVMGGTSSVEQVRNYVQTSISETIKKTVNNKTTTVDQATNVNQFIEGVDVVQKQNCPMGQGGGSVNLRNVASMKMEAVLNMTTVDTTDLARKVSRDIEDSVNATAKSERRGTEAISGDTQVKQAFTISDVTVQRIEQTIQNTITTNIKQKDDGLQVISRVTVEAPCQGTVNMSNELVAEKMATDLISNIANTVASSDEADTIKLAATGETDSKSTGTLAVAMDSITSMVNGFTTGGVGIVLGICLLLFLLIYGVQRFFGAFVPSGSPAPNPQIGPPDMSNPLGGQMPIGPYDPFPSQGGGMPMNVDPGVVFASTTAPTGNQSLANPSAWPALAQGYRPVANSP